MKKIMNYLWKVLLGAIIGVVLTWAGIYFDLSQEIIYCIFAGCIAIIAIVTVCIKKANGENITQEQSTLYRKPTLIHPESQMGILISFGGWVFSWVGGLVWVFDEKLRTLGIALLLCAIVLTLRMFRGRDIEKHKKIIIPSNWPGKCYYPDYKKGLYEKKPKQKKTKELEFYKRCVSLGIKELNGAASEQKAILLAKSMGKKDFSIEAVRKLFEAGKQQEADHQLRLSEYEKKTALNKIRIEELHVLAKAMRFYGIHGREKRVAMLQTMYYEARESWQEAKAMGNIARSQLKKEQSWGIHGGLASGIAGPAAGLVAAMQVEQTNAAIRDYNAVISPYVNIVASRYNQSAYEFERRMERYKKDMEATKTKLVSDDDTKTVFKHLIIENITYAVSETGAVVVEADFSVSPKYRIFDTVAPAVDGTVYARLHDGTTVIGVAPFVFPVDGVTTKKIRLAAICTRPKEPTVIMEIEMMPKDLWAIEPL